MVKWAVLSVAFTIHVTHAFVPHYIRADVVSSFPLFANRDNLKELKFRGFDRSKLQSIENFKKDIAQNVTNVTPLSNNGDAVENLILESEMFKQSSLRAKRELDEKMQRLQEMDSEYADDTSVGAVPDVVANRMLQRIAVCFGVPVFGGLSIFVGAFIYSKKYDLTLPPVVVAYATQLPFVIGLMGITYGIMSASWDAEPGSLLGFKELKINVKRIREGLARSRDQETLREQIRKDTERLERK